LFGRPTVIPRGAPVRRDIVKIAPAGQRRRVTIDLENLIGVGNEKYLRLNYAILCLNEYVAFVLFIIMLLTIRP